VSAESGCLKLPNRVRQLKPQHPSQRRACDRRMVKPVVRYPGPELLPTVRLAVEVREHVLQMRLGGSLATIIM